MVMWTQVRKDPGSGVCWQGCGEWLAEYFVMLGALPSDALHMSMSSIPYNFVIKEEEWCYVANVICIQKFLSFVSS